jgi:hypothetical protein
VTALADPLWMNRHTFGPPATQICASAAASVSAEGGGTTTPTLMGGGTRFSREHLDTRRRGLGTVAQ